MGSRRCPRCETQWPYRDRFTLCPLCGIKTGWSSAPAAVTKATEEKAAECMAAVAELQRDMLRAEGLSKLSGGLLTVGDVMTSQWHATSG